MSIPPPNTPDHAGQHSYAGIRKLLVANRSEIAIRVMRAASELRVRTIGIFSQEDRFALHRFKADESYLVGKGKKPIDAYLDIDDILRIAKEAEADAIHPGYGFLAENPDFADACAKAGLIFVGPKPDVLRAFGNKVSARNLAIKAGVPVMPATEALPADIKAAKAMAAKIGYPLMLKASWGGGGRGMRVIESEADLATQLEVARREAKSAFGNDEVYLEKLVKRAHHVEVQILGDQHGALVHLFERDCSVQRRNQKVVERAPAPYLDSKQRAELCAYALALGRAAHYTHAGTVEFLMDADTKAFYFIEVNPRVQVEHTVTEEITGIDIVKAQIRISEGAVIGDLSMQGTGVPLQDHIELRGHALQCRITTEDPENNFMPDYGRITAYRSAAGFGVRLDGGTAYAGALITPNYDSLLVKVTTWAPSLEETARRMDRALREFRIRGVSTNLAFLENVINHPVFLSGASTTRFIDETPELFHFTMRQDRATKLLQYVGEVIVNGNPDISGRTLPHLPLPPAALPKLSLSENIPAGTRTRFKELGAKKFSEWMNTHKPVLLTDTSMRDAHQSLFATRMRTYDMAAIAPYYARHAAGLFSLECWGGATFDVAMRFLKEDPWERLDTLREAVPNILFQMLLRASNAVGYTNYPDNVVKFFVAQAAKHGIDVFRVFDSLNWVDNMRVAIDAVNESSALCEGAICYTSDIFDAARPKYQLKYYVDLAKQLEKAGCHILGIKDMAGLCKPRAAKELMHALKNEVGLPIHFHTHDTSGISAASVLAAIDAGCNAVDGALDSLSGLTSQPNLGSIVAALEGSERAPNVSFDVMNALCNYWEGVRRYYAPFEPDMRAGTSDVYHHEMPGGQYTNLREQARAMGLESRWPDICVAYEQVNQLFGDIVKVTPTSKVVGDMALFMITSDLTPADVLNPARDIAFPESVVQLMRGELGYPPDGFPEALQKKVLKGQAPIKGRPGEHLAPVDLEKTRTELSQKLGKTIKDTQLASYLMYPKVYSEYAAHRKQYSDTSVLPTPVFFYGMKDQQEASIDIEPGKTLVVRKQGNAEVNEVGEAKIFFELNGQPRIVRIPKAGVVTDVKALKKADLNNPQHLPAPMPGKVGKIFVSAGQKVKRGDSLLLIEAMKMESLVTAERDATIAEVLVKQDQTINAKDLIILFSE